MKASQEVFEQFCTEHGVRLENCWNMPGKTGENTWRMSLQTDKGRHRFTLTLKRGVYVDISENSPRTALCALCLAAYQANNDYKDFLYEQDNMPDTEGSKALYAECRKTREHMLRLFGEDGFNRLWFDILYED